MSELENKKRIASETRETRETKITASIDLDGTSLLYTTDADDE